MGITISTHSLRSVKLYRNIQFPGFCSICLLLFFFRTMVFLGVAYTFQISRLILRYSYPSIICNVGLGYLPNRILTK